MYKSNRKRLTNASRGSNVPQPVVMSQKPTTTQKAAEEPEKENEDLVPCSQDQNVPSSQNEFVAPSQSRFLSQRHTISQVNQQHQLRGKNFFEIALITCKLKISDLGCEFVNEGDDPISFTRKFRSFLCSNQSSENAKKFLDGFNKAFSLRDDGDSIKIAQKFLSGFIMREAQKTHQSQTSLIQCFFAVAALRDEVAKSLLRNLKEYVMERGDQADAFIVGLVMVQFKFSDQVLSPATYDLMYETLFEILAETRSNSCREVIISNFRDLDEFKQDDAVKRLLKMYEDNHELLTPFIETFTEMSISASTKVQISSIVEFVLDNNCDPKLYPGIVKYLIYYMESPQEIVRNLRDHLQWKSGENVNWMEIKSKVVLMLEKSVRAQKSKVAETWIKAVNVTEKPKDLKVLDFVMLLVITSVKDEKEFAQVKRIFVQKIPDGFFSSDFVKEAFATFPTIIAQYTETLLEMLNALQKNNIHEINEFSSACFTELFAIKSSDKKEIVASLVQFLCEKTEPSPFAKSDFKMMTLNILGDLARTQSSAESLLLSHKVLLRVLDLSKVNLTFNEHRLMMELLCKLAYNLDVNTNHNKFESTKLKEECSVLSDHLEMVTNKLMYNPDMKIKQLGIIGAIKIVSALVVNTNHESEPADCSQISISDIPAGKVRDAAKRVQFVFDSVRGNQQGFGMICDELALEFQCKRSGSEFAINSIFLMWLSELMFKQLDKITGVALTETFPDVDGLKLVHKLQVSSDDFSQPEFAVKLGVLVFGEKSEDVVALPALFKLTRLLMLHRAKGLAEIYVFSVMPITVYEEFLTDDDDLSVSDDAVSKQKLDLHFYCANWLRELIGTYCHFTEENREALVPIVVKRIKQLVQVEKALNRLAADMSPNYYPPPSTFLDIEAAKKAFDAFRKEKKVVRKPPKKIRKKNDSTTVDTSVHTAEELVDATNKIRPFCREIDTQVVLILTAGFRFTTSDLGDGEMGLHELMFLLDDVYHKIKSICNPRGEQSGFFDPLQAIRELKDAVIITLVNIFHDITGELVTMSQTAHNEDSTAIFYTKDANLIKNCFCLILRFFDVVFSCPQLKHEKNKQLLMDSFITLVPEDKVRGGEDQDELCALIVEHCSGFEPYVKNCDSAVALVKFLQTICGFSERDDLRAKLTQLCETFLKKEWKDASGEPESGSAFNAHLVKLLEVYVSGANLARLDKYVNRMVDDFRTIIIKTTTKQKSFPSFTKTNSYIMVRAYLSRLTQIISRNGSTKFTYDFWDRCSHIFNEFNDILKCMKLQKSYIEYLQNFIIFMRVFNAHGIPVLNQLATASKKEKLLLLVKNVQLITRFAHGLEGELKHLKNRQINNLIPKLREAAARNYHAIIPLLTKVGLPASAVQMGALKNFDINGEEILSQNSITSNDSNDDEEADEPMEASDDETLGNLDISNDNAQSHTFRSRSTIL